MSTSRAVRIAIVDDDTLALNTLEMVLSEKGFKVATYPGGQEFLDSLNAENLPDLVLLDVKMPDPNGIATLEIVRRSYDLRALPIILLTAMEESALAIMGFKGGANDYINKPVDLEELTSRISLNLQQR